MTVALQCDEALVRRLPLPLAQLYRRAHNAHRAKERKETAYCLWEAAIKLLGCVCVCEYAQLGSHDARIDDTLQNLARPALGHWVGFIRQLLPVLREQKVPGFDTLHDAILKRRDDLPRVAGLYAILWQTVKKQPCQRHTVQPLELFDRLTEFRNQEVGHGAIGQHKEEFYALLGNHLLAGAGDLLGRIDLLAGRRLYYLQDLRKDGGLWISHRLELDGQSARSVEPLTWPIERGTPPEPQAVYLDTAGPRDEPGVLCCLRPLVIYDEDDDHLLFLNSRTGNKKTEYLSYQSGKHLQRPDLGGEHRALLRRVLKLPTLDEAQVAAWAEQIAELEKQEVGKVAPTEEKGRRIGEFELVSELGRGGQSIVYRAVQPSLNREVALKRLLMAGNSSMDRHFLREIRALGRVDHPNLIKIYTSGVDHEQWFYAMELIEGANLGEISERLTTRSATSTDLGLGDWQDMLAVACEEARHGEKSVSSSSRPLSPRPGSMPDISLPEATPEMRSRLAGQGYVSRIVDLLRQVALATHALHEAGIIHRDIKPANIMVDRDGTRAVLMDLGLAKLTDQSQMSMSLSLGGRGGGFVGTYRYASPEQANPQLAGSVDARSDVYSLGATLWELLTLKPLFGAVSGNDPDLIRKIQQDDPPLLRSIHRKIHPDLEAIVARALEKKPARRYASAKELADDLQRYLNGEPVHARPVGKLERWVRYVRRRPLESLLAVVCVLGVLAVSALLFQNAFIKQIQTAHQAAEQAKRSAEEAQIKAEEANRRLTEVNRGSLNALALFLDRLESGPFKRNADVQPFRYDLRASLDELAGLMKGDPEARPQLADLYLKLGRISRTLDANGAGRNAGTKNGRQLAEEAFTNALDLYPDPAATRGPVRRTLAEARIKRGELYVDDSKSGLADADLQAALALLPEGDDVPLDLLNLRGEAYHQQGRRANSSGAFAAAVAFYDLALADRAALLRRTPEEPAGPHRAAKNDLARVFGFKGDAEVSLGRWEDAKKSYDESLRLRDALAIADRTDPEYAFQMARGIANFAYLEREQFKQGGSERIKAALAYQQQALLPRLELFAKHPSVSDYRRDLLNNYLALARSRLFLAGQARADRAADVAAALSDLDAVAKLFPAREKNEIRPYQQARSQAALLRAYALTLATPPARSEALAALAEAEVFFRAFEETLEVDELYDAAILAGLRAHLATDGGAADRRLARSYLDAARKRGFHNEPLAAKEFALEGIAE